MTLTDSQRRLLCDLVPGLTFPVGVSVTADTATVYLERPLEDPKHVISLAEMRALNQAGLVRMIAKGPPEPMRIAITKAGETAIDRHEP